MRILFILLSAIIISSCCTKEYCVYGTTSGVSIQIQNMRKDTFQIAKLYLVGKADGIVYDSALVDLDFHLSYYTFGRDENMKGNLIVIQAAQSLDTLYNIDYTLSTFKKSCNKCFLKSNKEEYTSIENFSFEHENKKYSETDTLIIEL